MSILFRLRLVLLRLLKIELDKQKELQQRSEQSDNASDIVIEDKEVSTDA
ncbi:MAG: hypothetical protein WBQ73_00900 [Candidatus Babeliales bacterium]